MKRNILLVIIATCCFGFSQAQKDLNIDYMLRGCIYAESSITDTTAAGGFARSTNAAKKINDSIQFSEKGFFMKIDTSTIVKYSEGVNGYRLFMVNKSDTVVMLIASDSKLKVLAEVYYEGKWQPIEFFPRSFCGNSFHKVYLKPNEYWSFDVPKFSGKIKTLLRYRLILGVNQFIYSNAIVTNINSGQVTNVKDYNRKGAMDPYMW